MFNFRVANNALGRGRRRECGEGQNHKQAHDWAEQHSRMKAKLIGFITPEQVPWIYSDRDESIPARYARAIAAYRQGYEGKAVETINGLIAQEPQNPYFHELKGQMLVDFFKIEEAIPAYRTALEKAQATSQNAPLIQIALAHALLESQHKNTHLDETITLLKQALIAEPRAARAHRLIASAYGRQGNQALTKLHLAEEAVLQRRYNYAKRLAQQAVEQTEKGSTPHIQAQDVLAYIENRTKSP